MLSLLVRKEVGRVHDGKGVVWIAGKKWWYVAKVVEVKGYKSCSSFIFMFFSLLFSFCFLLYSLSIFLMVFGGNVIAFGGIAGANGGLLWFLDEGENGWLGG